jgi:hypothetical protein
MPLVLRQSNRVPLTDGRVLLIPMGSEVVRTRSKLLWNTFSGKKYATYYLCSSVLRHLSKDPLAYNEAGNLFFTHHEVCRVSKRKFLEMKK